MVVDVVVAVCLGIVETLFARLRYCETVGFCVVVVVVVVCMDCVVVVLRIVAG